MVSEKCWFEFMEGMARELSTKSRILSRPGGRRGQEEGTGKRVEEEGEDCQAEDYGKKMFNGQLGQLLAHGKGQNWGGQMGVQLLAFSVTRDLGQSWSCHQFRVLI